MKAKSMKVHVSDGAFLIRSHPLGVVVAEQRFRGDGFLHEMRLSKNRGLAQPSYLR